ncbi:tetratricopeptide repeat protein [Myxococcota bacterium]|nr:tetratricopeptide repeat protein [Myxococcota bacterium]MBU1382236.1 tetratricopeptide repeat protein [Myxococcota bacterium]MBU1496633.1 tetratricopeptide repeat protein [Myxococcota bacterium]
MKYLNIFILAIVLFSSCSKTEKEGSKLYRRAEKHFRAGNREIARSLFFEAYKKNPRDEDGLMLYADFLLKTDKPRAASHILAVFLGHGHGKASTWYKLGESRYFERKYENAVEALDEAIKRKPKYPEAALLLGKIYENYEEWVAAKDIYLSVAGDMKFGKRILEVLVRLALLEMKEESEGLIKAEAHLLAAISIDSSYEPAIMALGSLYMSNRQPQKAQFIFENWLKLKKEHGPGHLELAKALLMQAKYSESIGYYKKAIEYLPEDIAPVMGIIEVLEKLNRKNETWDYLLKASTMEPQNKDLKWKMVPFYLEKKMFVIAYRNLEAAAGKYSMHRQYWEYMTVVYEGMGNYKMAFENYMKLLSIGGSATPEFSRKAGLLARYAGLYKRASEFLKPLLSEKDHEVTVNYWIAEYYQTEKKNEQETALKNIEKPWQTARYPQALIWSAFLTLSVSRDLAFKKLEQVKDHIKNPVDRLFYLDVLAQYYHLDKKLPEYIDTLKKMEILSRNSEEKGTIKQSIKDAEDKLKNAGEKKTVMKKDKIKN